MVRRHCLLNLQHYDKGSLFAGKLHALLSRRYVKGREVYDLMWYLSDRTWPEPNIVLLSSALKQTGWKGQSVTVENWRKEVSAQISKYDWDKVSADVRPFVEKQRDSAHKHGTRDEIKEVAAGKLPRERGNHHH